MTGIGEKVFKQMECKFSGFADDFEIIEVPFTKNLFYYVMMKAERVSRKTVDGYWDFAREMQLMKFHDGGTFIDLDILYEDSRFDFALDGTKTKRTGPRTDRPATVRDNMNIVKDTIHEYEEREKKPMPKTELFTILAGQINETEISRTLDKLTDNGELYMPTSNAYKVSH